MRSFPRALIGLAAASLCTVGLGTAIASTPARAATAARPAAHHGSPHGYADRVGQLRAVHRASEVQAARAATTGTRPAATTAAGGGGYLDPSIGVNGLTLSPTSLGEFEGEAAVADDDGGLYVAAVADDHVELLHFTSPGTYDTAFTPVRLTATDADALAVEPDTGDIYVLVDETAVYRVLPTATIDGTFGTGGKLALSGPSGTMFDYLSIAGSSLAAGGFEPTSSGGANSQVDIYDVTGQSAPVFYPSTDDIVTGLVPQGDDGALWTTVSLDDDTTNYVGWESTSGITFNVTLDYEVDALGSATLDDESTGIFGAGPFGVVRLTADGHVDTSYGDQGFGAGYQSQAPDGSFGSDVSVAGDATLYETSVDLYPVPGSGDGAVHAGDAPADDEDDDVFVIKVTKILPTGALDDTFGTQGSVAPVGTAAYPLGEPGVFVGAQPVLLSDGTLAIAGSAASDDRTGEGPLAVGQLTTSSSPGDFVADRQRLADTRSGGLFDAAGDTLTGAVSGAVLTQVSDGSVPVDATAVTLDVSVVSPASSGYLRVTSGFGAANTTAMNFAKGVSQTVLITAPIASDGSIQLDVSGSSNIVVDLLGYQDQDAPTGGQVFTALPSSRIVDSRNGIGTGKSAKNGAFPVTLPSSVPAGATAVIAVSAVTPTAPGFLQLAPAGGTSVTAVNYVKGVSATAPAYVMGNSSNQVLITTHGSTQVTVDLLGYFATPAGSGGLSGPGAFVPIPATRILDTRGTIGGSKGAKTGPVTVTVPTALVPTGATAVIFNITGIGATASGYLRLAPTGSGATQTIMNIPAGGSLTALSLTSLSASNQATITLVGTTANLVVDVVGYDN